MKNTLGDLNLHLFMQLERLGDEELTGEKLADEISRAKSITSVASQIIANGQLVLDARKLVDNSMSAEAKIPKMLEG